MLIVMLGGDMGLTPTGLRMAPTGVRCVLLAEALSCRHGGDRGVAVCPLHLHLLLGLNLLQLLGLLLPLELLLLLLHDAAPVVEAHLVAVGLLAVHGAELVQPAALLVRALVLAALAQYWQRSSSGTAAGEPLLLMSLSSSENEVSVRSTGNLSVMLIGCCLSVGLPSV